MRPFARCSSLARGSYAGLSRAARVRSPPASGTAPSARHRTPSTSIA